jgi:hypothetical protein
MSVKRLAVFVVFAFAVFMIFAAITQTPEPEPQQELVITKIFISDNMGYKTYHVFYLIDGVAHGPALCGSPESVDRLLQVWARGYTVSWLDGAQ